MKREALFLENHDIDSLNTYCPQKRVGVSTNHIYLQIAKYAKNPDRSHELSILIQALDTASSRNGRDLRYTPMPIRDVVLCFKSKNGRTVAIPFIEWDKLPDEEKTISDEAIPITL